MSEQTGKANATDDRRTIRRARTGRRIGLAALTALVLAGATGMLGVRTATAESSAAGTRLLVTYPSVARPGLAIGWTVRVERTEGFDGPVRLATTSRYLALFDENGLDPDPAASTADGDEVIWDFEPPPGRTLVVSFDARIEPGIQWGYPGTTRVIDDSGATIVSVSYRTWVIP